MGIHRPRADGDFSVRPFGASNLRSDQLGFFHLGKMFLPFKELSLFPWVHRGVSCKSFLAFFWCFLVFVGIFLGSLGFPWVLLVFIGCSSRI